MKKRFLFISIFIFSIILIEDIKAGCNYRWDLNGINGNLSGYKNNRDKEEYEKDYYINEPIWPVINQLWTQDCELKYQQIKTNFINENGEFKDLLYEGGNKLDYGFKYNDGYNNFSKAMSNREKFMPPNNIFNNRNYPNHSDTLDTQNGNFTFPFRIKSNTFLTFEYKYCWDVGWHTFWGTPERDYCVTNNNQLKIYAIPDPPIISNHNGGKFCRTQLLEISINDVSCSKCNMNSDYIIKFYFSNGDKLTTRIILNNEFNTKTGENKRIKYFSINPQYLKSYFIDNKSETELKKIMFESGPFSIKTIAVTNGYESIESKSNDSLYSFHPTFPTANYTITPPTCTNGNDGVIKINFQKNEPFINYIDNIRVLEIKDQVVQNNKNEPFNFQTFTFVGKSPGLYNYLFYSHKTTCNASSKEDSIKPFSVLVDNKKLEPISFDRPILNSGNTEDASKVKCFGDSTGKITVNNIKVGSGRYNITLNAIEKNSFSFKSVDTTTIYKKVIEKIDTTKEEREDNVCCSLGINTCQWEVNKCITKTINYYNYKCVCSVTYSINNDHSYTTEIVESRNSDCAGIDKNTCYKGNIQGSWNEVISSLHSSITKYYAERNVYTTTYDTVKIENKFTIIKKIQNNNSVKPPIEISKRKDTVGNQQIFDKLKGNLDYFITIEDAVCSNIESYINSVDYGPITLNEPELNIYYTKKTPVFPVDNRQNYDNKVKFILDYGNGPPYSTKNFINSESISLINNNELILKYYNNNYTFDVLDSKSCINTIEINEDPKIIPTITIYSKDPPSCNNGNGLVSFSINNTENNNIKVLFYDINKNLVDESIIVNSDVTKSLALKPGSYFVNLFNIDKNFYTGIKSIPDFNISNAPALVISNPTIENCKNTTTLDGKISLNVNGLIENRTYKLFLNNISYDLNKNNSILETYNKLPPVINANIYIKDDQYSCISNTINGINILRPAKDLEINLDKSENPSCFGYSNGKISVYAEGGWPPYNYELRLYNNNTKIRSLSISSLFDTLPAGKYNVYVQDSRENSHFTQVTLTNPELFTIDVNFNANFADFPDGIYSLPCFNSNSGKFTITPSGGSGIKKYALNNKNYILNNVFDNIGRGYYTIYAMDENGCEASPKSFNITTPDELKIEIIDKKPLKCQNDKDANVKLKVSGGSKNAFSLFNINNNILEYDNTFTFENLDYKEHIFTATNTYRNKITNKNVSCNVSLNFTPESTHKFTVSTNFTQSLCYGVDTGKIEILGISNGSPPFSYNWFYTPHKKNIFGQIVRQNLTQFSTIGTNLSSGDYNIIIKDNTGCQDNTNIVIKGSADPLKLTIDSALNFSCKNINDSKIKFNATGGSPRTFDDSNDSYKFFVNDFEQFKIRRLTQLTPNIYKIKVLDQYGCFDTSTVTITEPDSLILTVADLKNVYCNGDSTGFIEVKASGGNKIKKFTIDNGKSWQTITKFEKLIKNNYSIKVVDEKNCSNHVDTFLTQPDFKLDFSISKSNVICKGTNSAKVNIIPFGGTKPYTISWTFLNKPFSNLFKIDTLSAGIYNVRVTDFLGCIKDTIINILEPANKLEASIINHNDVSCFGAGNGNFDVKVSGGYSPYLYSEDSLNNYKVSSKISSLLKGPKKRYIKDTMGCIVRVDTIILEPAVFTVTFDTVKNVNCYGGNDGWISFTPKGGNGAYKYSINNGNSWNTIPRFENLIKNNYTILSLDKKNCMFNLDTFITQPSAPLNFSFSQTNVICKGTNTAKVNIIPSGGTKPYEISWIYKSKPLSNLFKIDTLYAGLYNVRVTDSLGCIKDTIINILEPDFELKASVINNTPITCFGDNDGSFDVNTSGGYAPYLFSFDSLKNYNKISLSSKLSKGTKKKFIKDTMNCIISISTEINEPDLFTVSVDSLKYVTCFGSDNGWIAVTPKGGNAGYFVHSLPMDANWEFLNNKILNLSPNYYDIKFRDKKNCEASIKSEIKSSPSLLNVQGSFVLPHCGKNDGAISLDINGGTFPYSISSKTINYGKFNTKSFKTDTLRVGIYTFEVKDSFGCIKSYSKILETPSGMLSSGNNVIKNTNCNYSNDGEVKIFGLFDYKPYKLSFFNKDYTSSSPIQEFLAQDISPNSNLKYDFSLNWSYYKGDYIIFVESEQGCANTIPFSIFGPNDTTIIHKIKNPLCFGEKNGSLTFKINGATAPYNIELNAQKSKQKIVKKDVQENQEVNFNNLGDDFYDFVITDANLCNYKFNETLKEPDTFKTIINYIKNPTCYKGSDGKISLITTGGTLPYNWKWSSENNPQADLIEGLSENKYSVELTDYNKCFTSVKTELKHPSSILPWTLKERYLCINQTDTFRLNKLDNVKYVWTSNLGFYTEGEKAIISKTAKYNIKATNNLGCIEQVNFDILRYELKFNGDYLAADSITAKKKITFIDVSFPEPDSVVWNILDTGYKIDYKDYKFTTIIFNHKGSYRAKLRSYKDKCFVDVYKVIKVGDYVNEATTSLASKNFSVGDLFESVEILPNPNRGKFLLKVKLRSSNVLKYKIIDVGGSTIEQNTFPSSSEFTETVYLTSSSGLYILYLEAGSSIYTKKIIVEQ